MEFELVPNMDALDDNNVQSRDGVGRQRVEQRPSTLSLSPSQLALKAASYPFDDSESQQTNKETAQDIENQIDQAENKIVKAFNDYYSDSLSSEDQAISEYIDLTVPITYRVKFNFTPEKVMMRLSRDRLRRLHKVWEQSEDGLTLAAFAKLMILEVPSTKEEKLEMLHGLIRLFKQVDIDGDQKMQWSEFVQYIIDQVQTESVVATQDAQGQVTSIAQKIRMQQAARFQKLKRAGIPVDKGRHRRPMADVIMCHDAKHSEDTLVMHSEENSTTVQWYTLSLKPLTSEQVPVRAQTDKVIGIAHQDVSNEVYAFGPQGTDSVYGVLCSDHTLYFYIRNRGKIELFYQFNTGDVHQTRVWFMPKHKAWLTAGKDFQIRQWNISPIAQHHQMGEPFKLHSDLITDCCEINSPFCIATASLDRTIVLYDLKNREALRRFARKHVTGIRHLRYMQDFGGMIISTGFEIYANVWGPQNLYGNTHLGRLRGHKKPISAIDVIQTRPFVFTIDTVNEVIIWDIRNFTILQVIPAPSNSKERLCHGLLAINTNLLWAFGGRFITYDKQRILDETEVEIGDFEEMKIPINAFHNSFFSTICVHTPQDIQIFSCEDGGLVTLHQSVFKDTYVNCTQFRQDKRHRKAYLASNDGQISVLNVQSGVTLKRVFEDEDAQEALERQGKKLRNKLLKQAGGASGQQDTFFASTAGKKKVKVQKEAKPRQNKQDSPNRTAAFLTEAPDLQQTAADNNDGFYQSEQDQEVQTGQQIKRDIVDVILVWEEQMNQIIYADKQGYFVYNEADESKGQKLRHVKGGHIASITVIKFSYHLSLVATGAENGEVAVWDYELSQLLGICIGTDLSEVTAIEFLKPYPVMVTASIDGKVCLWAVRPTPVERCHVVIGMFYNVSFNGSDDTRYPVRAISCFSGSNLKGISRGRCMKHSMVNAETYRDFKTTQVLSNKEDQVRIDPSGVYRGLSQIKEMRVSMLTDSLKMNEDGKTKIEQQFEEMRLAYLPRMEYLDPDYDTNLDEQKPRVFLHLGDDFGILKLWDLTYLLQKQNIDPCRPFWEVRGDQYFPSRTETVNVIGYANRLRQTALEQCLTRRDRVKDPEDSGLIIREALAHKQPVAQLNSHLLDGLLSVAKESEVRLWSNALDLWGIINCRNYEQDALWHFPMSDKRKAQGSDIVQLQTIHDHLRQDDEQAVEVERDSDLDDEAGEHFTTDRMYDKLKTHVQSKKAKKMAANKAEQDAIIEERRQWQIAIKIAKGEKPLKIIEVEPVDRNKITIDRIERLQNAEDVLHEKIQKDNDSGAIQIQMKGNVVMETANKMDRLIQKALKRHERQDGSTKRSRLNNNRSFKSNRSRVRSSVGNLSDTSSNKSRSKSPLTKLQKKISDLSINGAINKFLRSPDQSPLMARLSKAVSMDNGQQQSNLLQRQRAANYAQKNNLTDNNLQLQAMEHPSFSKAKSTMQNPMQNLQPPNQKIGLTKNKEASNMSIKTLKTQSSVDDSINEAAGYQTIIIPAPRKNVEIGESNGDTKHKPAITPIPEYGEVDSSDEEKVVKLPARQPIERSLDDLNKTQVLMKKAEASMETQSFLKQTYPDKEYVEDTKEDRQQLIKFKNLPSIRDKLFSIKHKQQKINLDPKYNSRHASSTLKAKSALSSYKSQKGENVYGSSRAGSVQNRPSAGRSPFVPPRKTHQQAMNELAVIARDLEAYNKNRNFYFRAKSVMLPEAPMAAAHEVGSGLANQVSGNLLKQRSKEALSSISNQPQNNKNTFLDSSIDDRGEKAISQISSVQEQYDAEEAIAMQEQMEAFQQKLLARDSNRHDKIRLRNLANSRTPQDQAKHSQSLAHLQRSAERQDGLAPLQDPLEISNSQLAYGGAVRNITPNKQPGKFDYGPNILLKSPSPMIANLGQAQINLDIAMTGSKRGRNAQAQYQTENQRKKVAAVARHEILIDEQSEKLLRDGSLSQLSAAFKHKLSPRNIIAAKDEDTAAQSISIEQTLEKDASRQFLDVNFSIGESHTAKGTRNLVGRPNEFSQILPRNISLSQVSASVANHSEAAEKRALLMAPSSLYNHNLAQSTTSKHSTLEAASQKPRIARRAATKNTANWKAARRVSEQTRMNDMTGLFEQVDMLDVRKKDYMSLKQKYTGPDSGMAQLMKREAENIQRQRERISELRDYKAIMRSLKDTNSAKRRTLEDVLQASNNNNQPQTSNGETESQQQRQE